MSNTEVTLTLAGKEYKIPHLPISVMEKVVPLVMAMPAREAKGEPVITDMITIVAAGLEKVAGITEEQVRDMPTYMDELRTAVAIISVQCGMRTDNNGQKQLDKIKAEEAKADAAPLAVEAAPNPQTSPE